MTYSIEVAHVEYDDPGANSHKFWRYYVLGNGCWAAHWGRVGTTGQVKVFPAGGRHDAASKLDEKLGKGYSGTRHFSFNVDDTTVGRFRQSADLARMITMADMAKNGVVSASSNAQAQIEADAYAEEQLKATLLRMRGQLTDPELSATPVGEPAPQTPAPEAPDPKSMEARLGAALAKASKKQ